jgi:hypothetical protein
VQHALAVVPDVAAAPVALPGSLRRFDRDHVGAEVRQRLNAHGAEQEMIETDDPNSLQQIEHRFPRDRSATHYARCKRPLANGDDVGNERA